MSNGDDPALRRKPFFFRSFLIRRIPDVAYFAIIRESHVTANR